MVSWVLFLGIGLVVGVVAGLYFARLDDVSNKQKNALQQKLDQAEQQLETYKSQVTEHFLKTASLVNSMTESYKAVHEHLALGARALCDSPVNVAQLEMPATKLLDSANEQEPAKDQPKPVREAEIAEKQTSAAPDQETETTDAHPEDQSVEPKIAARKDKPSRKTEEVAEQPKESVEAIQPPSTPESLHVDEDSETAKNLKEAEQTTPANLSRMVH